MEIGIIGAGKVGATLANQLAVLGHSIRIANSRGPQSISELASVSGIKPVELSEVLGDVSLVILAIPESAVPLLPSGFFVDLPLDVPVVDAGNYYPRQHDGPIDEIETGTPESVWVQSQIGFTVTKAFNSIFFKHLLSCARPSGAHDRRALPVAGDDLAAKRKVMRLIDELGFDSVDAGLLADSWRQQPGTPVYGLDTDIEGIQAALAAATPERKPEWRAAPPIA